MVEWESLRPCEHQTIKARQTVGAIGHGKLFLESASKQAKVFMAEEYFDQVDFAIAVFTIFWYPVHKRLEKERKREETKGKKKDRKAEKTGRQ